MLISSSTPDKAPSSIVHPFGSTVNGFGEAGDGETRGSSNEKVPVARTLYRY